jgi:hypothetical protein
MTRTWAYLDPGSAGVILQMIGGGLAAIVVTLKLYGRRILQRLHIGAAPSDAAREAASKHDAP